MWRPGAEGLKNAILQATYFLDDPYQKKSYKNLICFMVF